MADLEGSRGSGSLLKNHKNIKLLSNTSSDPLKNYKAVKLVFNIGPTSAPAGGQKMALL